MQSWFWPWFSPESMDFSLHHRRQAARMADRSNRRNRQTDMVEAVLFPRPRPRRTEALR